MWKWLKTAKLVLYVPHFRTPLLFICQNFFHLLTFSTFNDREWRFGKLHIHYQCTWCLFSIICKHAENCLQQISHFFCWIFMILFKTHQGSNASTDIWKNNLLQWIGAAALRTLQANAVTHWLFKYVCENPTNWCGDKSKKFQITTLSVAMDHDYNLHSPSKLVDVGCEVLLDKPPHKVRLCVHF